MSNLTDLASYIEHTNLNPDATAQDIKKLCNEAVKYKFHAVCVHPYWLHFATKRLVDTPVKLVTVIGFPLGSNLLCTKAIEAEACAKAGANELDMVMNISAAKADLWDYVGEEIQQVVRAVQGRCVKVILETCLLSREEIIKSCQCCSKAGAHFVKTSTGFGKEGATVENIAIMKTAIPPNIGIKAAGGIRDKKTALSLIEAGATRIGTSASMKIIS